MRSEGYLHAGESKSPQRIKRDFGELRDRILRLKVILVNVDNEDDAYIIFETLNTRGKDLTSADLVKNLLLRFLRRNNKNVDIDREKWNSIGQTFEASQVDLRVDRFLHHFWLSRYDYVGEKLLFKQIKKYVTYANAAAFLDTLVADSRLYRQIQEPSVRKWLIEEQRVREALESLGTFRVTQPLPFMLSAMREYSNKRLKVKWLESGLGAIENFHFLFTILTSKSSSGGISAMYALHARQLLAASLPNDKIGQVEELRQKLRMRRPSEDEVVVAMAGLRFSTGQTLDKRVVQYVLGKYYRQQSGAPPSVAAGLTIEHLAPESGGTSWRYSEDHVASIGNLFLVTEELNERLANKSFEQKKVILKRQKAVWFDPDVLKLSSWDDAAIEERTKRIGSIGYRKIWKV
jgi:hypothetical protein